jgi:hypothetical protein
MLRFHGSMTWQTSRFNVNNDENKSLKQMRKMKNKFIK